MPSIMEQKLVTAIWPQKYKSYPDKIKNLIAAFVQLSCSNKQTKSYPDQIQQSSQKNPQPIDNYPNMKNN